MTKTFGLTHLAIAVKDIGKTLDFYTRVFEMEVMYHEDKMIQLTTPGNHDILVFEKKRACAVRTIRGYCPFWFQVKKTGGSGRNL